MNKNFTIRENLDINNNIFIIKKILIEGKKKVVKLKI